MKPCYKKISENVRPIHQEENTTLNNAISKDVNIKSSKDKSSKYQSPSKLINDNNAMEKSALTKEKINIQLNDVRKESRKRFHESKGKKWKTRSHWSGTGKKGTILIVGDSVLAGIEQKRISGNRSVNIRIFPGATTHDMHDYLKPLLKKNPDNIILHFGTNNSVNKTYRNILSVILSLKNFIEKLRPECKVILLNMIYRSDNGKASLAVKNVNDHLDALNIDVVDNRNIVGNCLNNSGLHLNSTRYGNLAINFIRKMKTLSQSECGKIQSRITPNTYSFYTVKSIDQWVYYHLY